MTKTTLKTDSHGWTYRYYSQKTQVTCGPACCLMMWANVNGADPIADEGGVIALSQKHPKPWNAKTGAEINNLSRVLAAMGVANEVATFKEPRPFRTALHNKVQQKKPALAFAEWEVDAAVKGHFVVVGYADSAVDKFTILDPTFGMHEINGMPAYYPVIKGDDTDPVLRFTGAVIFVK